MFLAVHASAGILISQAATHPAWAFFGALGSHYLLDIIPHGDEGIGWWIHDRPQRICWVGFLDLSVVLLSVALFLFFRPTLGTSSLYWALIGTLLPDFLSEANHQARQPKALWHRFARIVAAIPFVVNVLEKHSHFHHSLHHLIKRHLPWRAGLGIQIIMAWIFFYLVLM